MNKLNKIISELIKEVLAENSVTGCGCDGASMTPGQGEQYASPRAFKKKYTFKKKLK